MAKKRKNAGARGGAFEIPTSNNKRNGGDSPNSNSTAALAETLSPVNNGEQQQQRSDPLLQHQHAHRHRRPSLGGESFAMFLLSSQALLALGIGIALSVGRALVLNLNHFLMTGFIRIWERAIREILFPRQDSLGLVAVSFFLVLLILPIGSRRRRHLIILLAVAIGLFGGQFLREQVLVPTMSLVGDAAEETRVAAASLAATTKTILDAIDEDVDGGGHRTAAPAATGGAESGIHDKLCLNGVTAVFEGTPDLLIPNSKVSFTVHTCKEQFQDGDWVGLFAVGSCTHQDTDIVMCQSRDMLSSAGTAIEPPGGTVSVRVVDVARIVDEGAPTHLVARYCRVNPLWMQVAQLKEAVRGKGINSSENWSVSRAWSALTNSSLVSSVWQSVSGRQPLECLAESVPIAIRLSGHEVDDTLGQRMRAAGARPKYPVVMIPGIITTALEVWEAHPRCHGLLGKRLWLDPEYMLLETECWLSHMTLDLETGLDSPGIRVRPLEGHHAADYLLPNEATTWVWGRLIETLKAIGYDQRQLRMVPYDWRLSPMLLERRDRWMSQLKATIEMTVASSGERAVLVTHSMGAPVLQYFLEWVENKAGAGVEGWANEFVSNVIHVGGVMLGAVKPLRVLLSGDSSDMTIDGAYVAYTGPLMQNLINAFFPAPRMMEGCSSFGSLQFLLPRGGSAVWPEPIIYTHKKKTAANATDVSETVEELFADDLITIFNPELPGHNRTLRTLREHNSLSARVTERLRNKPRAWTNPLAVPLRTGPKTAFYCLYSVDGEADLAYHYVPNEKSGVGELPLRIAFDMPGGGVDKGVGDGTVPLVSLGLPCALWKRNALGLNPNRSPIRVKEFKQQPGCGVELSHILAARRSPCAVDHVSMIGNDDVLQIVANVATGNLDEDASWTDGIMSNMGDEAVIQGYIDRIQASPEADFEAGEE